MEKQQQFEIVFSCVDHIGYRWALLSREYIEYAFTNNYGRSIPKFLVVAKGVAKSSELARIAATTTLRLLQS